MSKLKKLICFFLGTHLKDCHPIITSRIWEDNVFKWGWKCLYCKTQSKDYPKEGLNE